MDIQFACRCGQKLCVEERGAGMTVACPKCGGEVVIPQRPSVVVRPVQSKRRPLLLALAPALLILCIGFYFTPHLAVYRMRKAAENKDSTTLSDYVDYPALRESLKANISAVTAKEVAKNRESSGFEALGAALAAAMINHLVDALVTPEAVAMMMKGESPQLEESGNPTPAKPASETETSMGYEGLNRFVVKAKEKGSAEDPVELVFLRHGVISWKLSALRLPTKA